MKLTTEKIKKIGILANSLTQLYKDLVKSTCVLRSRELRRPNIKGMNADAVFRQEAEQEQAQLYNDLSIVDLFSGFLGYKIGLSEDDIAEFMQFCIDRQLKRERGWDSELTDEERGML